MSDPRQRRAPEADGEPLLVHDQSLSSKVARGSEAGDIVDQQVRALATELVLYLTVLLRIARTHGRGNKALEKPLKGVATLVRTLGADHPVALRAYDGFVFLGESHLRATPYQQPVFETFMQTLAAAGAGGIVFAPDLAVRDLNEFALAMAATLPGEDALQTLREALARAGVTGVALEEPRLVPTQATAGAGTPRGTGARASTAVGAGPGEGGGAALRSRARAAYGRAAVAVQAAHQAARDGGPLPFRQARRAIQSIADLLAQDPPTVLGLTTLRSHDEYTHNHSVNVALLSMALGNRVGYPRPDLAELGLAALFHDVGKCQVPPGILDKAGELTPDEWVVMRTHPSEGVLALLAIRGLDRLPAALANASFEHHLALDGLGYPDVETPWRPSLSSRIITVADYYDAMTASRVYRRVPIPPPNALAVLVSMGGTQVDPVLVRLFATCVGIVPIGTMVLLTSGEMAVVARPASDPRRPERPVVCLVSDESGQPVPAQTEVDLLETGEDGLFVRTIERIVDNTRYHLDTSRYLA